MKRTLKEMISEFTENMWNVPNVLTILRIVLIPLFIVLRLNSPLGHWALAVFLIASFTDFLDGYLARKNGQITNFGKLMDPLADKVMVCTALILQVALGIFPFSAVIIVLGKELLMVIGGVFMLRKGVVVYSNLAGKAAQVFFIVSLTLSFFQQQFREAGALLWGLTPDLCLLWITVGLAVYALGNYTAGAVRQLREKAKAEK